MGEHRVVNTSPLIYLSRAGLLELLRIDADKIVVPQAVVDEIGAWPTADAAQRAIRSEKWLVVAADTAVPPVVAAWDLGRGESAVLTYATEHQGVTAVVDDLAARRCAAAMGIEVRGTLGLVLVAKKRGLVASARTALAKLRDAGMYLSDAVAEAALREIGE